MSLKIVIAEILTEAKSLHVELVVQSLCANYN